MKLSSSVLMTLLSLILADARGQSADTLVSEGRAFLAQKNLTNANTRFAAAVSASPNHETANALYGLTRLLVLPGHSEVVGLLDRLGVSGTNRDLFNWTASISRDVDGVPVAPPNLSVADAAQVVRTKILPEMTAAAANLAKITSTNFVLNLTAMETSITDVAVDYGDFFMLRALLHFVNYLGYTITGWNLDVQLTALRSLHTNDVLTMEKLLGDYPQLFTFATTNDLFQARQVFSTGAALYATASAIIRNRPPNVTRLFNYDEVEADAEADFRVALAQVNESLKGPVVLIDSPNATVNFGNHFSNPRSPRALLPEFSGNALIAGTLPDETFGGVLRGAARFEVERFLASDHYEELRPFPASAVRIRGLAFASAFIVPQRIPDGSLRITLNALEGSLFVIQVSTNLQTWTDVASVVTHEGTVTFSEPVPLPSSPRYYRALDGVLDTVSVIGNVRSALTEQSIPGARVELRFAENQPPVATATADPAGNYSVWALAPSGSGGYFLDVSAGGHTPFQHRGSYYRGNFGKPRLHFSLPVYLAPPGYRPPNDDFAQRQVAVGTDVILVGASINATSELGEPNHISNANRSIWWTWTAADNGAVSLDTISSPSSIAIAVYTGNSLDRLASVARDYRTGPSGASLVRFFVTAGTTYQIAVDGFGSGRAVLNLRSLTPMPPKIERQPQSQNVMHGSRVSFYAEASGIEPLTYQWRKNGVDIPGARGVFYSFNMAQTNDAGIYNVVVSNAAGSESSSKAELTVRLTPPEILTQPKSQSVSAGSSVNFNISFTGSPPLRFQWRKSGLDLTGAVNQSYTISNVQTNDAGTYSVAVSNAAGSVTSSNALLTVTTLLRPPNDLFADRATLPGMNTSANASNVNATKEPGEPNHAGDSGGRSLWWTWTAPIAGMVIISTAGSSFDTVLAVYRGTSLGALTTVASNDDSGSGTTSQVGFQAVAGTAYQIAVDGYDGASGNITLAITQ